MAILQKTEAELLDAPAIQILDTHLKNSMSKEYVHCAHDALLVTSRQVITLSVHQDECTGESLLQGGWACKPAQQTQSTKPEKKRFSLTRGPQNSHKRMSINGAHCKRCQPLVKGYKVSNREKFSGEWLNPSSPEAEASGQIS